VRRRDLIAALCCARVAVILFSAHDAQPLCQEQERHLLLSVETMGTRAFAIFSAAKMFLSRSRFVFAFLGHRCENKI
jgi:hypothetical protein